MVLGKEVKVSCKRCSKQVPVSDLALDPLYRMVVCSGCVKERKDKDRVSKELATQQQEKARQQEAQRNRPAGWDSEDDYLARKFKEKVSNSVVAERIDDIRMKYRCPKCNYTFIYNRESKTPSSCPYCGREIQTFRFE